MKTINTLKKVSLATFLTFVLSFSSVFAQNDTMYIMKSGAIVGQYNVNTEVDSVIFYKPTIEETTSGTFIDSRDGNEYNWVQIGDQVWMAENLAYLPSVNMVAYGSAAGSYYYVYGYDGTNVADAKATDNYATYGVLYNWTAAMDGEASSKTNPSGIQGVCPAGWHVPSDAEWTTLENYLIANGYNYDGTTTNDKIAKAMASSSGWESSTNEGVIGNNNYPEKQNASGFSALPGGYRFYDGTFYYIGFNGNWWSATEYDTDNAWYRFMGYDYSNVDRSYYYKELGFSVRCVRD